MSHPREEFVVFFVRLFQPILKVLNGVFVNVVDVMNYESRTVDIMNILSVCCLMIGKWQNLYPWRIGLQVAFR